MFETPHIVGQDSLLLQEWKVSGIGRIEFQEPLSGYSSNEHFLLSGHFLTDSGEFEIHNHFTSFNHLDGVQLSVLRRGQDLEFSLSTPGYIKQPLGFLPKGLDSSGAFRLRIEIHHSFVQGLRILVWNDRVLLGGNTYSFLKFVSEGNADLDTARTKMNFLSFGEGIRWGLRLSQVRFDLIARESPYVASH